MGKLFLLTSYFVITPTILCLAIVFSSLIAFQRNQSSLVSFSPVNYSSVAYAALPSTQSISQGAIQLTDARTELVRQFFARYGSPLEPYADHVVSMADKYNLDFRLLPAIAMQESNLCKKAPEGSNNCWGYGIYGGRVKTFPSYEQAIEAITKTLAKDYKDDGLHAPEEIVKRYTPSDNGRWVYAVTHFMEQLQ